uniref:Alpha 1,4-glycosyltransferase domain-containing protein n=1 Tax=Minutocellus polymorphus TaxID=265543 RepID=A0A7S0AHG6_9STRA|mmetsp:Transcript_14082/g.23468  ORF Transcript_14082/g.23468 Transcript_14082/m.23468 type:complete len:346 (+) Transcript_14082:51-1088(+)
MPSAKSFFTVALCTYLITIVFAFGFFPQLMRVHEKNAEQQPTAASTSLAVQTITKEKSICEMTQNELQQQTYLRRIWQFWDGEHVNGYMELCHELMLAKSPTIFVDTIDSECIKRVFPDAPSDFDLLIPAHKADYARCRLLTRFGGMYNDYDTIALQSFQPLFDKLDEEHSDIVRHRNGKDVMSPMSNLGPMKPNLPGISSCKDIFHRMMKQRVNEKIGDKLVWPMCSPTILRPLAALLEQAPNGVIKFSDLQPFDEKTMQGSYIFLGTDAEKQRRIAKYILEKGNFEGTTNQYLVVLNNYYNEEFGKLSREEAYCEKHNPISIILRSQMQRAELETPGCSKARR